MNNQLPAIQEKGGAFNRILRFMTKADITLLATEEKILDRWVYCDVLMRDGTMSRDEMVKDIVSSWGVSKFTALNDLDHAQQLFARSRQVSKKYLVHLHAENVKRDLQRVRQKMFVSKDAKTGEEKERSLTIDDINALAKMNDSYTKALLALPDETVADALPPPVFIFQLAENQKIEIGMSLEDALKEADSIIDMEQNDDGTYEPAEDDQ